MRTKFTTTINKDVLKKLKMKTIESNLKNVNQVIEALVNNFLDYLDEDGNINANFSNNDKEEIEELLQEMKVYLKTKKETQKQTDKQINNKKNELSETEKEIEKGLDDFMNHMKF